MKKKDKPSTRGPEYEFMGPLTYWTSDEKEIREFERLGYKKISEGEFEIPEDEEELRKDGWIRQPDGLLRRKIKPGKPLPGSSKVDLRSRKLAREKRTRKGPKLLIPKR